MKIRTAFVSNSSTSSFLCITTLENHEKTLQAMGEKGEWFRKVMHPEKQKVLGKDALVLHYTCYEDCISCINTDKFAEIIGKNSDDYEILEIANDMLNLYESNIKKNKKECFSYSDNH